MIDSRSKRRTRTLSEICRHTSSTAALPRRAPRNGNNRAIDHPIDVVIDLGLDIFGLVFIDRAMQRA
jgi:hypothetical protein